MPKANQITVKARRELFKELLAASLAASGALRGIAAHLPVKNAA